MKWKYPRVYVVECEGFVKIGKTLDMDARFSSFQTNSPFPVHLLMIIENHDAATLERQLHRKYRSQRVKGEWFKLSVDQLVHLAKQYKVKTTPRFVEKFELSKFCRPDPDNVIHLIVGEVGIEAI